MSKFASLFLITLVLFFFSTIEARHAPAVSPTYYNPAIHHHHHHHHEPAVSPTYYITKSSHGEDVKAEELVDVSELCVGDGEEECLMRRSLEANIDYIYTQKNL